MKYFLDTEFTERGNAYPVRLISLGVCAENGDTFYAISSEFTDDECSDWVKANVLSHLGNDPRIPTDEIGRRLLAWMDARSKDKPEFWGYYADYDWVVFCQMFGTMMDLPKGWPMYCRDIKQMCDDLGNPKLPPEGKDEHNALADARWNKQAYEFLRGYAAL